MDVELDELDELPPVLPPELLPLPDAPLPSATFANAARPNTSVQANRETLLIGTGSAVLLRVKLFVDVLPVSCVLQMIILHANTFYMFLCVLYMNPKVCIGTRTTPDLHDASARVIQKLRPRAIWKLA